MQLAAAVATTDDRRRWQVADREARPQRIEAVRSALAERGLDAYFGLSPENVRYLTGFRLGDGEDKVSGASGRFFISADESVVIADSRYRLQAVEECPDSRVEDHPGGFAAAWPELLASLNAVSSDEGVRRIGVEAGHLSHAAWLALAKATPEVELIDADGLVETQRQVKDSQELERVAAACAVADLALTETLPEIRPGVTEHELAMALEWRIRTSGAQGLAFDVACLSGPRAALPHGSPGDRRVASGEVLLFDFGAQVDGYRSDMTRTLFVGEPSRRDLELYELVAGAQAAALELLEARLAAREPVSGREVDAAAREVIAAAGHGDHFGHGTGHGIGLATHELPSLGRTAPDSPLPSPTVFSVEPGVYLDEETGIRIEDLAAIDAEAGDLVLLTTFPSTPTIVGT